MESIETLIAIPVIILLIIFSVAEIVSMVNHITVSSARLAGQVRGIVLGDRLLMDVSLGLIDWDSEKGIPMYYRIIPERLNEMNGTGFNGTGRQCIKRVGMVGNETVSICI